MSLHIVDVTYCDSMFFLIIIIIIIIIIHFSNEFCPSFFTETTWSNVLKFCIHLDCCLKLHILFFRFNYCGHFEFIAILKFKRGNNSFVSILALEIQVNFLQSQLFIDNFFNLQNSYICVKDVHNKFWRKLKNE